MKKKKRTFASLAPRCPYCGSHTVLRSADGIYNDNRRNTKLYVCKNYPRCDAYVRVQSGSNVPLGTLANRKLRALRAQAHRKFDPLYKEGYMTREDAYEWLAGILAAPYSHAHIGHLSEYSCKIVIREAEKLLIWYRSKRQVQMKQYLSGGAKAS